MAFGLEKKSEKESGNDNSFVKKVLKKVSPKERRQQKKKSKIRNFLKTSFQQIASRAGALMDYLVKGRKAMGKIVAEGIDLQKAIDEQKGYYDKQELQLFMDAAAACRKEEYELLELSNSMHQQLKRDVSSEVTARHMQSDFEGAVTKAYTRFTAWVAPVILKPKTNIPKPKEDHSSKGLSKVAAVLLLGMHLTNSYFQTVNLRETMELDIREHATFQIGSEGSQLSAPPPPSSAKSFADLKKDLKEQKENISLFKDDIKFFGKKLEGKKFVPRLAYQVDVEMEKSEEGERLRQLFGVKLLNKLFDFGVWNVRYT